MSERKKTSIEEKRLQYAKRLREILSHPEFKGKVLTISQVLKKLGRTLDWYYANLGNAVFAQEWLTVNQDAPIDAKLHYENMLEEALKDMAPDKKLKTMARTESKEFYVPIKIAQEKTKKIALAAYSKNKGNHTFTKPLEETETKEVTVMKQVSEEDHLIERIRNSYVYAELGDMPNVTEIMKRFKLLGPKSEPLTELTEEKVRQRMMIEDWRMRRSNYLHMFQDIVTSEVKTIVMVRCLEMHKMLMDEGKLVHRANVEYYKQGFVTALGKDKEGKPIILEDFKPKHGVLSGIAEAMRRLLEPKSSVNIYMDSNGPKDNGTETQDQNLSPAALEYLARLRTMNADEIDQEIDRLDSMRRVLRKDRTLTLDEVQDYDPYADDDHPKPEKD